MTLLFFYTPVGLILWIVLAMYHMRRQHQIREKNTALYYLLLFQDYVGVVADVAANYSWFSVFLLNCPRKPWKRENGKLKWDTDEITMSQHMERINDAWVEIETPSIRQWWAHFVSSSICRQLNKLEVIDKETGERKKHC